MVEKLVKGKCATAKCAIKFVRRLYRFLDFYLLLYFDTLWCIMKIYKLSAFWDNFIIRDKWLMIHTVKQFYFFYF